MNQFLYQYLMSLYSQQGILPDQASQEQEHQETDHQMTQEEEDAQYEQT
jgi:hypothetical protein